MINYLSCLIVRKTCIIFILPGWKRCDTALLLKSPTISGTQHGAVSSALAISTEVDFNFDSIVLA